MGKISNQEVLQKITAAFGERISVPSEPFGLLTLETTPDAISELLAFLKNDQP